MSRPEPRYPMTFSHPGVAPGEQAEMFVVPAEPFVGREVDVSNACFEVVDVVVGRKRQLRTADRTLRLLFSFDDDVASYAFTRPLDAAKGVTERFVYGVKLVVRNTSSTKLPFTGCIFGTLARGRGKSFRARTLGDR